MKSALNWMKNQIEEPRHINSFYETFYLVVALLSILLLFSPPETISTELGRELTPIWCWSIFLGSWMGVFTAYRGEYRGERIGMGFIGLSVALYGTVVLYLHFTSSGSRIMQLIMISGFTAVLILRLIVMKGRDYAASPHT